MQGKKIDKFTLVHLIGEGGLAEVWYAENKIGVKAAVKILKEEFSRSKEIIERFENEAHIMVKLSHPNIRRVFDYDTIDSRPAIVMEYLDGEDLSHKLMREGSYTQEDLLRWWDAAVDALRYTHDEGVVHRDIKPSNLFITNKGDLKLLDFGISKVRDNITFTKTGTIMGTPLYMSPEQVEDSKNLDFRSDVYSLAVTFFQLTTRQKPYGIEEDCSLFQIQKRIVEHSIESSLLSFPWDKLLPPLLAKQADLRAEPQLTTEIAKDLSPIINPPSPPNDEKTIIEPIVPPTPKPNLEEKTAVNKKTIPWLIGSLATILIVLLAVFVFKYEGNTAAEKVFKSIDWVAIDSGSFMMGSPDSEVDRSSDEGPLYKVTLSAFKMSAHCITFEQYDAFCEATYRDKPDAAGWGRGDRPVINVSWEDAVAFAEWLGGGVRLPTEAEWEYACRAGTMTPFHTGANLTTAQANYDGNYPYNNNAKGDYRGKTVPVGSFAPNAWGLYDMHGNVREWCSDWYARDYYSKSQENNPKGPSTGSYRVYRGGSWSGSAQACRSAHRYGHSPTYRSNSLGFRLVCPQ